MIIKIESVLIQNLTASGIHLPGLGLTLTGTESREVVGQLYARDYQNSEDLRWGIEQDKLQFVINGLVYPKETTLTILNGAEMANQNVYINPNNGEIEDLSERVKAINVGGTTQSGIVTLDAINGAEISVSGNTINIGALPIISNDFITVTSGNGFIEIGGNSSIIADTILEPVIQAVSGTLQSQIGSPFGGMYQLVFLREGGGVKNRWLSHYGDTGNLSNQTPGVILWKSKLVGLSFSNKNNGADTEVQIHSANEGDGNAPTTVDYSWVLDNVRVARKTNFSPDVVFDPGDKVGIYVKDRGKDPKDVTVIMYLQIIEDSNESGIEDYSGNFGSSGSGTS